MFWYIACTDCSKDIKAGGYEGHDCVPSLTPEEEKQAVRLLKSAISTSPEKASYNFLYRRNSSANIIDLYGGYIIYTDLHSL